LLIYDSWDERYKRPFGAVAGTAPFIPDLSAGSDCRFRARATRFAGREAPAARGYQCLDGDGESDDFSCSYSLARPGLTGMTLSSIRPTAAGTSRPWKETGRPLGARRRFLAATVCLSSFRTPDWLKGGIIYQIMPDASPGRAPAPGAPGGPVPAGGLGEHRVREDEEENTSAAPISAAISRLAPSCPISSPRRNRLYLNRFLRPIPATVQHGDYLKIDPCSARRRISPTSAGPPGRSGSASSSTACFSHTGDDSRYFNGGDVIPAEKGPTSRKIRRTTAVRFSFLADDYRCWWGVKTLPEVNETNESYLSFIMGRTAC
jgi:hypothetical protein